VRFTPHIILLLLFLILSGFKIVKNTDEKAVIILLDLSDSTESVQDDIYSHAEELLALIDEKTPVGVVMFGADTLYSVDIDSDSRKLTYGFSEGSATNIDEALEYAATLLPADRAGQIIVMSDGKETDGDAQSTAHYLSTKGIRIDAVYFDSTGLDTAEMQLCSVNVPEGAYKGDEITVDAEVKSNTVGCATLKLFDNDTLTLSEDVTVDVGVNNYFLTATASSVGTHSYKLVLETSSDTLSQNNSCFAYMKVSGAPTVLIIADTVANGKVLANLLSEENEVTTVTAPNAPKTIFDLCKYDEVILSNVDMNDLPSKYDTLLETYVGTYGRSLLTVGGTETLMYGHMEGTKLEDMLPVTLSVSEMNEGQSVALMLVLDCSMSMSNTSTYLAVAKQGAIGCIDAMTENDWVGVVSFNRSAYLKSKLIKATDSNKESLTRIVSGLTTSQGTYYTQALQMAYENLLESDADVKHIIFLSDGQPSDSGYNTVAKNCAANGITVSTIGLGYSSTILKTMAETAGGRYYYVSTAKDLPNIMLSETEQVTVSSLFTGEFVPLVNKESDLTDGLEVNPLPKITGYLGTTIKEEATALITTEDGNPVYAIGTYGIGTVACFTSDLSGKWTADWMQDETGLAIIKRMVGTTVSDVHNDSSLSAEITVRGNTTDVKVKTLENTEGTTLSLTLSYAKTSATYVLTQTEPGIYETSVVSAESGLYQTIIYQTDATGNIVDWLETAFAVSYSAEYDAFAEGGDGLLENVCSYSGGSVFSDMEKLAKAKAKSISSIFNPMVIFALISMILLLADIAVRKLRWKDIKNYLFRPKKKATATQ